MQNTNISGSEFYKVLQEVKKYCKLKANIRNQSKTKIKQITKEQREELLKQGRERSKNLFYQKLQLLTYSGCQCHIKYEKAPSFDNFHE